ncbi:hypothetical protein PP175_04700 [Aneurinibacillus sp. Ricciae_BoGa-3]|uniref:hypothetical protein n=1 Tax=Aneurinibacillus sp. Ricciae_BoGa-3 TaxID=3022697 RepID=UPI002341B75B|nr:hypothetical protein [Aneurinibacillus sp. Ricciae_BoGa-3]WCK55285.1 hypothetical protein PP175_04700 [Aneurinibacillus sp. Ricciae_BoGa-3]
MIRYIEGILCKASNNSPMLCVDNTMRISIMNGEAVQLNYNGEWISGIHIGGNIINYGGKDKLRIGDKIRIRNKDAAYPMTFK